MRILGRPRYPDLSRSPGVARLVLDEGLKKASVARRLLKRAARQKAAAVVVDLRDLVSPPSDVWAAIVKGVRDLAKSVADVTVHAGDAHRHLLELSNLARFARIVIAANVKAA